MSPAAGGCPRSHTGFGALLTHHAHVLDDDDFVMQVASQVLSERFRFRASSCSSPASTCSAGQLRCAGPARSIRRIWDRNIDPGKVFDVTLPLDQARKVTRRWTSGAPSRCCWNSDERWLTSSSPAAQTDWAVPPRAPSSTRGTWSCCTRDSRAHLGARRFASRSAGVVVGDLGSAVETRSIAEQVNAIGRMDAVIHNAGISSTTGRSPTPEGHATILAVNTLAPYVLTALIERPRRLVYVE